MDDLTGRVHPILMYGHITFNWKVEKRIKSNDTEILMRRKKKYGKKKEAMRITSMH